MKRASLFLGVLLAGCGGMGGSGGNGGGGSTTDDLAQYNKLASKLDASRSVFDKTGGQNLTVAGSTVFWVDASGGDHPVLHSSTAGQGTTYGFPIFAPVGDGDNTDKINFVVTTDAIATMNTDDGGSVYAAGSSSQLLYTVTLPSPPYGQKWWPYTMSGTDLYVALQKENETAWTLQKFTMADPTTPTDVLVFDQLVAPNPIDEFIDFYIDEGTVIFDDHGRFWMASLSGGLAHWVQNDTEIAALSHDSGGVVYNEGSTLWRYSLATDTRVDLTAKIMANSYQLNTTFASADLPTEDVTFCENGTTIYYVANSGLFSYDFANDVVKPVLLDPLSGTTVTYIDPIVTADGTVFVTGLLSDDGAVGADGPIYEVTP